MRFALNNFQLLTPNSSLLTDIKCSLTYYKIAISIQLSQYRHRSGLYFWSVLRYDKHREFVPRTHQSEESILYTEQDFQDIGAQVKRRTLLIAIPAALLLAGIIVSFILRIRWLTTGLSLVLGAGFIFCYGLLLAPVLAYRRHLDEVLHGRVRTTTGAFKEMEETAVMREGVKYYPMMLSVGDMDNPEDDRLFYYDANLPRPDWQIGDMLTVTAHDKALGAWVKA